VSTVVDVQGQFKTDQAWHALTQLVNSQLDGVDVKEITSKDFNDQGVLILEPPSVRIFYAGENATSTSDTQRLSYDAVLKFIILCADQDLRGVMDQAKASLRLVALVKAIVIGSRIQLADGDLSEPITYVANEPLPVDGLGIAYGIAFEVPGLAQFPGVNAYPTGGN
jgi:phage gp37-like protein